MLIHRCIRRTSIPLRTMSQHIYSSYTPPQLDARAAVDGVGIDDDAPSSVKLTTHNQYTSPRLVPNHLNPNPLLQFSSWFSSALSPPPSVPPVREPEAMSISSVSSNGIPSSRIVLLKSVDSRGFIFFTNYTSRKSLELAGNGFAALAFHWKEVSRQIRVVGKVEKVDRKGSEEYFQSRPLGSRIGAWASTQSQVVGEGTLAQRVEEMKNKFGEDVPCPEHWGGWRVVPLYVDLSGHRWTSTDHRSEVEFWCGQPSRLHDRFRYTRPQEGESSEWKIERLAP